MNTLFRLLTVWYYRFLRLFGVETPMRVLLDTAPLTKKLDISERSLTDQDLEAIGKMKHLKVLILWENQITDITPLQNLANLTYLVLGHNQITDITPLQNLMNLTYLVVGGSQIVDIKPLQNLKNLKTLLIWENQITDITTLQNLIKLKKIYIQGNQITDITPLKHLVNLKELDLGKNQITHISLEFLSALPNLKKLYLYDNPIGNIPKEIFDDDDGLGINVLTEVRAYLESIQNVKDNQELNEAKLIIVGVGDVGKTEIAEALSAEDYVFNPKRTTTKGIRIKAWQLKDCRREAETVDFTAHLWDFAGQEINYGTHQFFLTKNSVYIFVWETRKGERESKFAYWLSVVSLLSDNAPIIVVQNKVDIYEEEINQRDWKQKFPNIVEFYKTSCLSGRGIEDLRKAITAQLLALPNTREIWSKHWYAVRTTLEKSPQDYITLKEYKQICEENTLPTHHADALARQLHDIGVILHFADDFRLSDTVVLKTDWATDAAYCLLDNKKVLGGRFQEKQLTNIWQDSRFEGKFSFLLRLMERFELVFKLQDKDEYIVPEGLPIEAPSALPSFASSSLRFEYHYKFMPKGILSRFICRTHHLVAGELFWRYGVVLAHEGAKALVRLNDVEDIITIAVAGKEEDTHTLLQIIREHLQAIHKSLNNPPLDEKVPCVCPVCAESKKPYLHDYATLLRFKQNKKDTRECAISTLDVPIDTLLKGIVEVGKGRFSTLERQLDRNNLPDFFKEARRLGLEDVSLHQLEQEFINGDSNAKFIGRLKVWLLGKGGEW